MEKSEGEDEGKLREVNFIACHEIIFMLFKTKFPRKTRGILFLEIFTQFLLPHLHRLSLIRLL